MLIRLHDAHENVIRESLFIPLQSGARNLCSKTFQVCHRIHILDLQDLGFFVRRLLIYDITSEGELRHLIQGYPARDD